ncbi:MAG TPA: HAMP domain-containing histidine kinase [Desulfobacteraceae bacterium]|nr:HAMP domain-containing histidine kinase [Desulfobacteraceae bacterium]
MSPPKKLIRQLYPSYLFLVFAAVAGATWYASSNLKDFFLDRTSADLQARAALVSPQVSLLLDPLDEEGIRRLCSNIGAGASTRITVILPSGRVVGDSKEDPEDMENHVDRPEFRAALSSGLGISIRGSTTLGKNLMYVAVPVGLGGAPAAVVRTAIAIDGVDEAINQVRRRIILAGAFFALAVAFVGFLASRKITRPLEDIRKCAEHLAKGDFGKTFPVEGCAEIRDLSSSMKKMALELRERIDTITGQRNRINAILSSMAEGVIAVDNEKRVITANQAAEKMLERRGTNLLGRSIQEVTRNTLLQNHIDGVLGGTGTSPVEITLGAGGRVVEAHGTELQDSAGVKIGALIVLNDVSDLRRLERVRRDFVANVSHELKTPITAVKGFVEALLDGGLDNRVDAERFLKIIDRHVNRLGALIDDLLTLARIEQGENITRVELSRRELHEVIETAVQLSTPQAEEKAIAIEISCPSDLAFPMDPFLMEQALANLLDNAVKYSAPNRSIHINASAEQGSVKISVSDQGYGIRKEHLDRIFERFYRVDKARSRDQGGTGLGLAIVKHIVQAHGGRITVESSPGKGSIFSTLLPVDDTG